MNSRSDKDRCGANKRAGGTCGLRAGFGTDHAGTGRCKFHGGASPNGRKSAQKEEARKAVESYGLPRDVEPHAALLEELHRTAGHVAWLQQRVSELPEEELHGLVGGAAGGIPESAPHVWIVMYRDERKHLANVAATCIKVGIEERRVRLAEAQGQLLAQVIRGVLEDLGVADLPEVPAVVRRHLTLVSSA